MNYLAAKAEMAVRNSYRWSVEAQGMLPPNIRHKFFTCIVCGRIWQDNEVRIPPICRKPTHIIPYKKTTLDEYATCAHLMCQGKLRKTKGEDWDNAPSHKGYLTEPPAR